MRKEELYPEVERLRSSIAKEWIIYLEKNRSFLLNSCNMSRHDFDLAIEVFSNTMRGNPTHPSYIAAIEMVYKILKRNPPYYSLPIRVYPRDYEIVEKYAEVIFAEEKLLKSGWKAGYNKEYFQNMEKYQGEKYHIFSREISKRKKAPNYDNFYLVIVLNEKGFLCDADSIEESVTELADRKCNPYLSKRVEKATELLDYKLRSMVVPLYSRIRDIPEVDILALKEFDRRIYRFYIKTENIRDYQILDNRRFVKCKIENFIIGMLKLGRTTFLTDLSSEIQIMASEFLIKLRAYYPEIKIIVIKKSDTYGESNPIEIRKLYDAICNKADHIKVCNIKADEDPKIQVEDWIIRHCGTRICVKPINPVIRDFYDEPLNIFFEHIPCLNEYPPIEPWISEIADYSYKMNYSSDSYDIISR